MTKILYSEGPVRFYEVEFGGKITYRLSNGERYIEMTGEQWHAFIMAVTICGVKWHEI